MIGGGGGVVVGGGVTGVFFVFGLKPLSFCVDSPPLYSPKPPA
jgi:hypothetical protein